VNFRPFVNGSEATIPIGKDCVYIKVPIIDDNSVEHDRFADTENFTLTATPVNGLDGGPVVETASIIDNDIQRISVVSNGDKTEGEYASWTVSVDKETTGRWGWAKYELIDGTTQRSVDYDPSTLEFSTNGGSSWAKLSEGSEFGYAFKPGENSVQVRVKTTGDGAPESTEALTLKVTPNTQGLEHLAPDVVQATVNIKDAPAAALPSLLIKDFSVTEGQEGQFIIGATSVLNGPNKLKLTVGDGSATSADYTNLQISTDGINFTPFTNGNEYSIASGKDCIYVKFLAVDDNTVEHDRFTDLEKFTITAVPISGFSGGQVVETAAIIDNDIQRISVVSNGDKTEGDYASWTVSVDKETTGRWGWAKYELVDGTTQRSVDYDPGTLEFSLDGSNWSKLNEGNDFGYAFKPGEKSIQVRVKTNGDGAIENTESLVLKVTPNTQGLEHLAPDVVQATVNIKDKAVPVQVGSVGDSKALEGEFEQFKVTLTGTSDQPTKVDLTVTGDTATAGTDFDTKLETSFDGGKTWTPVNGSSVDVPAGTKDFLVRNKANTDNSVEPNETFKLTAGANGVSATGTGTIEDKTVLVKVGSVSDSKAPEGEFEQFKVTLTGTSDKPTKVDLTTTGETATSGIDFDPKLETSFDGGKTWTPVTGSSVDVPAGTQDFLVRNKANNDNSVEPNETFKLTAGANGGSATGTGTIEDKTAPVKVGSVSDSKASEGEFEQFKVTLTGTSDKPTKVDLAVTGETATAGTDFDTKLETSFDGGKTWTPVNGSSVDVPAGTQDFLVRNKANTDNSVEPNETFKLTAGANGGSATGTGTIEDKTVLVKVGSVSDAKAPEGEFEQFKVTLTGQSNVPTKVELTLSGDSATLGTDLDNKLETSFDGGKTWVPVNGNSVDVAPGSTDFLVRTKATIDNVFEGIETFKLTANANGGSATGTGSIEDRTGAPKITSVSSPTAVEGQREVFDIKLSNSSTTPTDVNLSLTGDSADPAKDLQGNLEVSFDGGKTWSVINGANVTVPAGNTDFQVRTQTFDDTIFEGNETFKLTASTNGSSATGVATITDNDLKPVVKANLVGSNELQEGGDKGSYCIQLDQAADKDRFFTIQIDNGNAQRYDSNGSGQDFVWGGSYDISSTGKVFFGKVPNDNVNGNNNRNAVGPDKGDASWDFSVYNSQGQINKGNTVTIKVAAGQTKSEQFSVQAWNEKVTVDQDYHNPNGLNSSNYKEGSENFSLKITDAGDAQVGTGKLDVTIKDKSNYVLVSPIALDLNGDGIKTVSIDAGVTFDLLNTGSAVNVGWLSGDDGFLAIDKNQNGTIDDRNELFGGAVGEGFAQLASFDSNGDGQVDSQDSLFGDLAIWQDANINGKTDAGELKSLTAASIASLTVGYSQQSIADANGNVLGEKSTALNSNGQALDMVDVYFRVGQ
jgi:hypothetical protein